MGFFEWCREEELYISFHIFKHLIGSFYYGEALESKTWTQVFANNGYSPVFYNNAKKVFIDTLSLNSYVRKEMKQEDFKDICNYPVANSLDIYKAYKKIVNRNLINFKSRYLYYKKSKSRNYDDQHYFDSILVNGIDGVQVCLRYNKQHDSIFDQYRIHSCFVRTHYDMDNCHLIPLLISEMYEDDKVWISHQSRKLQRITDDIRKYFAENELLKNKRAIYFEMYKYYYTSICESGIPDENPLVTEFAYFYKKVLKKLNIKSFDLEFNQNFKNIDPNRLINEINSSESLAELSVLLYEYYVFVSSLETENKKDFYKFLNMQFEQTKFKSFIERYKSFMQDLFDDNKIYELGQNYE